MEKNTQKDIYRLTWKKYNAPWLKQQGYVNTDSYFLTPQALTTNNGTVTSSHKYHLGLTTYPCSTATALANTNMMGIALPAETDRCFRHMTKIYRLIIGIIKYASMMFPSL